MKRLIISVLFLTCTIFGFSQVKSADEIAVEKQIDALLVSWNNHNYADIANYATEDCDWVNIVGMWWKNRKEVQFAHQTFHDGMFKNVNLVKKAVHTRIIAKDVIVAHLEQRIGAYISPSGTVFPEADNLTLMIYVKKGEKWLLTAAENVVVVEQAQKSNPINKMPK
jgi:uncharacterized protein (TIGR02246 family)